MTENTKPTRAGTPGDSRGNDLDVNPRKGKQLTVKLKVGELKEEPATTAAIDGGRDKQASTIARVALKDLGIGVSEISDKAREKYEIPDDIRGIVVLDVDDDTDAAAKGLKRGDVIDEIQQTPITSPADAQTALQAARKSGRKTVLLRVVSGDNVRFLGVKVEG